MLISCHAVDCGSCSRSANAAPPLGREPLIEPAAVRDSCQAVGRSDVLQTRALRFQLRLVDANAQIQRARLQQIDVVFVVRLGLSGLNGEYANDLCSELQRNEDRREPVVALRLPNRVFHARLLRNRPLPNPRALRQFGVRRQQKEAVDKTAS